MEQHIIVSNPEIMSGTPVFRGTRVPVKNLFDYLESGETIAAFLQSFPSVTHEQAIAVLERSESLLIQSDAMTDEVAA